MNSDPEKQLQSIKKLWSLVKSVRSKGAKMLQQFQPQQEEQAEDLTQIQLKLSNENQDQVIKDNQQIQQESISELNKEISHQQKLQSYFELKQQAGILALEDIIYLSKLGYGMTSSGNIYLCMFQQIDTPFLVKCFSKDFICQQKLQKYIRQSKECLELIDHTFIEKFYSSYKDQENIYFLKEYIQGMELFDVIREIGLLNKTDCQFYVGSMVLMIEYIHTVLHIMYRDIKPESIIIDDDGYPKLLGSMTVKSFKNLENNRTNTIIGTPHYMAPEIIEGKGYDQNIDLWSIGVCLYEFMCGGLPYAEDAEDPYEIYDAITTTELRFPNFVRDKSTKNLIVQLLSKAPELRVGDSFTTLKQHDFFQDFNFEKLVAREIKPPYETRKRNLLTLEKLNDLAANKIPLLEQANMDIIQFNNRHKVSNTQSEMRDKDEIQQNPQHGADWDAAF